MRDLAVLFLHLLATVARLAGPGGARSVVAESVLVKQQLLILNRSRKRSPHLRLSDRIVAGLCALLMRPGRLIRSAIVLKPSTLLSLHRALTTAEISPAVLVQGAEEAGPEGTQPGSHRRRRRHETAESDLGLSTDRATDHAWPSAFPSTRMWCGAFSPLGTGRTRLGGAVLAHGPRSREGQSVESRPVSMRIGRPAHALGARRDGPMHASHRGLWRASRRRGWRGAVPDVQSRDARPHPADLPQFGP